MWTTDERDAWLGPALEQMSDEQLEAFDDAARQIFDRYPATEDDPDAATEALSGALMVILGDDTLDGLGGADRLSGLCGADVLLGGAGNDVLEGGGGNDTMTGGSGGDGFLFRADNARGRDRVTDFGADDCIVTTAALPDSNRDGIVDAGRNRTFTLGGGEVTVTSPTGGSVRRLEFDGAFEKDGVTYYFYSTPGGADDPASVFATI